ncbi:MAG: tyrosine-type recombinase/integrase [Gammaproteobacteria bacterium]
MARATRDARLETREARTRLKAGTKRYWRAIDKGLALGYRKGKTGGTWYARLYLDGKHVLQSLGNADDHQEANSATVLDYFQAQQKARAFAEAEATEGDGRKPYLVRDAIQDYLTWYAHNRKALAATRYTCETHILPKFGPREAASLTTAELRHWHMELASREGDQRAKRATANRILTVLKAALNHAWRDGYVARDEAWRRVKPFRNVDAPRVRYLSTEECKRLINACASDFRQLVQTALLTGCRYGELISMTVSDYNSDSGTVLVRESKSGKPRHVPLTDEGRGFFAHTMLGRLGDEIVFTRADGMPWGRSHQQRPLTVACAVAKITPAVSFHVLRHTYGSMLAMKGVSLQVIAEVLGHADTRITSRHYAHLLPSYVVDTIRAHLPSFGIESIQSANITPLRRSN